MRQYEYKAADILVDGMAPKMSLERALNMFGEEGWHLSAIIPCEEPVVTDGSLRQNTRDKKVTAVMARRIEDVEA